MKVSIVGSLRDREVACSASDRQGSNFESCVWRTVSSQSSHHPQKVLLAQFSLYVHKGGLKPDSFHFFGPPILFCKGKMQHLLTCKVSRCCLLPLQSSVHVTLCITATSSHSVTPLISKITFPSNHRIVSFAMHSTFLCHFQVSDDYSTVNARKLQLCGSGFD